MNLSPTPAARRKASLLAQDRAAAPTDKAAGTAFRSPSGRVLFVRRSDVSDHGGEWALPGGHIDPGETAEAAASREAQEELGTAPVGPRSLLSSGSGYTTFTQAVDTEFEPTLNEEHTEHVWADPKSAPQPLHPGVRDLLPKLALDCGLAMDRALRRDAFAFDRSTSVRTVDQDGRLHVAITNISKANVCEYLGSEIPGAEELGLDPKQLYKLLRDPKELAAAAASFNNIPLLSEHIPFSADEPPKEEIVGSTGTDAVFEAPYLKNSLVVWDSEAIKDIESREKQELSCAYRYTADMTPGTYEGSRYDGVMREIRGNHVAIVAAGRAGSDVIVGDSQLKESIVMKQQSLSRKATLVKGALLAFLCPRLATDSSINLDAMLDGVHQSNWAKSKPSIAAAVAAAVKTKKIVLAKDASIDGLVDLLDGLDGHGAENVDNPSLAKSAQEGEAMDADPLEEIVEMLKAKGLDDAAIAEVTQKLQACMGAKDTDPFAPKGEAPLAPGEVPKAKPTVTGDEPPPFTGKPEVVTKKAMDAALKKVTDENKVAMDAAVKKAKDEMRAITEAEELVKPYVGKLNVAFDSAEAVLKTALEALGVDVTDLHPSAYRSILAIQPRAGAESRIAQDSLAKPSDKFAEKFPQANRLHTA